VISESQKHLTHIMKKTFCLLMAFSILVGFSIAQTNPVLHIQNTSENKLEFRSKQNQLLKTLDLTLSNPYLKSGNRWERASGSSQFTASADAAPGLVSGFFDRSKFSKEEIGRLRPQTLSTFSDVVIGPNHAIVADQLMLFGEEGGLIGVKSQLKVYDQRGNLVGSLPENNDGYYEPVVTNDAQYIALNFGALSVHADYNLVPSVGFRIYDLRSNAKVFELSRANTSYDVLSPVVQDDIFIQVLDLNNDQYEYLVIDPRNKKMYRKIFTRNDVGNFIRFEKDKFIMRGRDGGEIAIEFEKSFTKDSL
jgi:hypothetical protein